MENNKTINVSVILPLDSSKHRDFDDEVATHQEFEKLYETVTQSKIK